MNLMDGLFSPTHLALSASIFVIVAAIRSAGKPWFDTNAVGQRILPILPLVFGVGAALLGFVAPEVDRIQDRLVVGVLCAAFSSQVYKLAKTTLLGRGLHSSTSGDTPSVPPPAPVPALSTSTRED